MAKSGGKRKKNDRRTVYGRVLRLKTIDPGPVISFVFFEIAITVAIVLALLGFVSWWGVLVLPVAVAAMVKVNDIIAGATQRSAVAAEREYEPEPEPAPEPEPQPEPEPASGMSASREHRKAVRERSREQKRVAREEQKSGRRGQLNNDTAIIPTLAPPTDPDFAGRTQTLPVLPASAPNQRHAPGSDATQQLPVVPDELDDFMTEIRGDRPPPWDPAGAPPEKPTGSGRKRH
ncbi:hypothetical protein GCM10009765_78670 [Fodinicola feengrottensis]|uniref:Uncharacterized protein n=1 Tax=Fodinicola feengrottensis TaxID=435914 RepID=A0ABP4V897_9ACTN